MNKANKDASTGRFLAVNDELSFNPSDNAVFVAEQLVVHGLLKDSALESDDAVNARVARLLQNLEPAKPVAKPGNMYPASHRRAVVAAVAASVLAVAFLVYRRSSGDRPVARLIAHGDGVAVAGRNKDGLTSLDANSSMELQNGQSVHTSRFLDSAEIIFADGTTVELATDTQATFELTAAGGKQIKVSAGLIQANVAPQPTGQPLRILTSTAMLEVLGTTLGVEVKEASTQLEVGSGVVSMIRQADGDHIRVQAGQLATATRSTTRRMVVQTFPPLPDKWSVSFDEGLPSGWWAGQLIETESGLAVLAAGDEHGKENNLAVTTQNAWREGTHGLFNLQEDSVLHVRFRQMRAAPLRLMLTTRVYPPNSGRRGVNLYYEDPSWNAEVAPDSWHTISIPLAEVSYFGKRGNFKVGSPPLAGLAAFIVQFSSLDQDIGLTVDGMWVTR